MVVLGLEVHDLAADHAVDGSGGVRDLRDDGDAGLGGTLQFGQHLVSVSLQAVAGENRDGVAKNLVARRTAATQVVVVEGGEIVMDQRIGMQHLERGAELFDARRDATVNHARGFHAQNGAKALATGKDAMAHRLMDGGRVLRGRREQAFERLVGDDASLFENFLEHEEGSITTVGV